MIIKFRRGASGGGELIHKFSGDGKIRPRDIPDGRRHSVGIQQREEDEREEATKLFSSFRTENRSIRKDKKVGFSTEEEERRERRNRGQEEEEEDLDKSDEEEEYGNEEIYNIGKTNAGWKMQRRREEEEEMALLAQIRQKEMENKRLKEEKEELERRVRIAEGWLQYIRF